MCASYPTAAEVDTVWVSLAAEVDTAWVSLVGQSSQLSKSKSLREILPEVGLWPPQARGRHLYTWISLSKHKEQNLAGEILFQVFSVSKPSI